MKRLLSLLSCLIATWAVIGLSSPALAFNPYGGTCNNGGGKVACGVCDSGAGSSACQVNGSNPVSGAGGLILKTVRIVGIIAGIAAVIMIIIGGLQYITAAGEASKVDSAKNTIMYAVIGLVVIIIAQAIVSMIVKNV